MPEFISELNRVVNKAIQDRVPALTSIAALELTKIEIATMHITDMRMHEAQRVAQEMAIKSPIIKPNAN